MLIKYSLIILLTVPVSCKGQKKSDLSTVRPPAVAGSFYPSDSVQLTNQLGDFFNIARKPKRFSNVAAIIVPHAGYVFSGQVAASGYAQLDPDKEYSRIFILGPSHYVFLNGASIYNQGYYSTPLGTVEVDTVLANQLIKKNRVFEFDPAAHVKEHCIEVQLPFLQYRMKHPFKIVPVVIGTHSEATCKKIADTLKPYFTSDNLFVISSDFSHYPDYEGALKADKTTADAIATNSPDSLLKAIKENKSENISGLVTSCCGWSAIATLLNLTSKTPGITVQHVKYMNSGDTNYGDKSRVVGYHSFAFNRKEQHAGDAGFSLTKEDETELLKLARGAIDFWLLNQCFEPVNDSHFSDALKAPCGAFVTLHKKGRLRGCIGRFITNDPLYKVVQQMAVAAAFQDYRFDPVEKTEMGEIDVEISVLTPLKRISNIDEFQLGKQGIYMVKGQSSGTFLPQVATDTGWTKEEFLGHCARDKAGIGRDGWKDAELYTYEAIVFGEKELLHR